MYIKIIAKNKMINALRIKKILSRTDKSSLKMSGSTLDIFSMPTTLNNYFARDKMSEISKEQKLLNWSFTLKNEFILLNRGGKKECPLIKSMCYIEKQERTNFFQRGNS